MMAFFTRSMFEEHSQLQIFFENQYELCKQQKHYTPKKSEAGEIKDRKRISEPKEEPKTAAKRPLVYCKSPSDTKNVKNDLNLSFYNEAALNLSGFDHPASWYRKHLTKHAKNFNGHDFHDKNSSQIGGLTHEKYLKLFPKHGMRSPYEPNLTKEEKEERLEIRRLQELVKSEQQQCQHVYERISKRTRGEKYSSFAKSIPSLFTHLLRKRVVASFERLHAVYVKDIEFDFSQMVFRATDQLGFQHPAVIRVDVISSLSQQAEGTVSYPPLTQANLANPVILNQPNLFDVALRKVENSIPQKGVIIRPEQIGHLYVNQDTLLNMIDTVCIVDIDILTLLASCSLAYDIEIVLIFSKTFSAEINKSVIKFNSEVTPLNNFPPRLHCSEAVKFLLEERFGSLKTEPPDGSGDKPTRFVSMHNLYGVNSGVSFVVGIENPVWVKQPTVHELETNTNMALDQLVFYVVKREMQCEFGLEELSVDEAVRIVMLVHLFPSSKVVLVRVDADCSCILHVTDYAIGYAEFNHLMMKMSVNNFQAILHKLLQFINKLGRLETNATYLLRRPDFSSKCEIFIQSNLSNAPDLTMRQSLNLKKVYEQSLDLLPTSSISWLPIDVTRIMPFHYATGRVPATFPISSSSKQNQPGSSRVRHPQQSQQLNQSNNKQTSFSNKRKNKNKGKR